MAAGTKLTTPTSDVPGLQNGKKCIWHYTVYAQGKWWILGWDISEGEWYLYRRDAVNDYVKLATPGALQTQGSTNVTMFLMTTGKLYIACPNSGTGNRSYLLTYNATDDDWDIDSGWPKTNITNSGLDYRTEDMCVFRDESDDIWVVRGGSGTIVINKTTDHGATWSGAPVEIRGTGDGLAATGTAVSGANFKWTTDHIGFVYSQNTHASGKIGFAWCPVSSDPLTKGNWDFSDDLSGMTGFAGEDDHCAMTSYRATGSNEGKIFAVFKASDNSHHIAERGSGTGGTWTDHEVTETSRSRPGIFCNTTDDECIVTVGEGTGSTEVEYFTFPIGNLSGHSTVTDLMTDDTSTQFCLGFGPYDNVNSTSNALFICGEGDAADTYENELTIAGASGYIVPAATGTSSTGYIVPAATGTSSTGYIVPTAEGS